MLRQTDKNMNVVRHDHVATYGDPMIPFAYVYIMDEGIMQTLICQDGTPQGGVESDKIKRTDA